MNSVRFNEPNIISVCLCAIRKRNVTYQYVLSHSVICHMVRIPYLAQITTRPHLKETDWFSCHAYSLPRLRHTSAFRHGFHKHAQGSLLHCGRQIRQHSTAQNTSTDVTYKVKQSRNRPGVAQRVLGGLGSQISWHSAHEGGEAVSLTHRPPLPSGNVPGTIFTRDWVDPRAMVRSEGICHWKIQRHHQQSIPGPSD
jgi:hypothetical protein